MVSSPPSSAAWATAIALALGCRSQSGAGAVEQASDRSEAPVVDPTHAKATPMTSPSSPSNGAPLVGPPSIVPWSRLPGAQIVDVAAPSGGAFEVPGPKLRPVRPWLELAGSPAGVAARVVQGDGAAAALALRGDQVVPIGAGALAVSARRDGLWVMYRDHLVHHDVAGVEKQRVELAAVAMLGAADDSVWVVGSAQAWHVDAAGAVRGPYPWEQPLASFAAGDALYVRDKRDARTLLALRADGARTTRPLAFELQPLEHPISLDGDRVVTLQGVTVRVHLGGEISSTHTFQVAGVGEAGRGFVVGAEGSELALWQQATAAGGSPEARRFPKVGAGSLAAAAVTGEQVSLYAQGQVALHRSGAAGAAAGGETAAIDEVGYREAIFPQAWLLSPRAAIAAAPGAGLVLAASGPAGVALVPVSVGW